MTDHPQTICKGIDLNGVPFEFKCDEKIVKILYDLNKNGIKTLFSCQENDPNSLKGPYFVFKNNGSECVRKAIKIALKYWKRYFIKFDINPNTGDCVIRTYKSKKNLIETMKRTISCEGRYDGWILQTDFYDDEISNDIIAEK